MTDKITDKQQRFCEEYLIDLNATQAAIRAGYSPTSAYSIAGENMKKPELLERIAELKAERSKQVQVDAAWVLTQAVKVHERCMQAEPVTERVDGIEQDTGEFKFEHSGANKALEIIGKHVDVQAFLEKKQVDANIQTQEQWLDALR